MSPPDHSNARFLGLGEERPPSRPRSRSDALVRPRGQDEPDNPPVEPTPARSTLDAKLARRMTQLGLSQQALAQRSGVSDSEISRLLKGQSKRPGLHNILRLARALDVSLDFLADDLLQTDPFAPSPALETDEATLIARARDLGLREVGMILDAARVLGFDRAIKRLYGLDGPLGLSSGRGPDEDPPGAPR